MIVDAIKESRKIFQRMNSYAIYRIAETVRVLLFMTLSILVFNFYPVTAVMLVLLALLNDGRSDCPVRPANSRCASAMDSCPTPQAEQSVVLPSGLVDHILFFSDSWMPVGSAFASANLALMQPGQAASIRLVSPWDPDAILTAKSLVTIGQQRVLIEEINYADLLAALMGLPQASLSPKQTKAVELAARSQLLPAPTVARPQRRPIEIASAPYTPHGVVLDYIQFTGGVSGYTFTNATYYISGTATVGGGGATFQAGACLKFASNACLVVSSGGAVSFPASGLPVVFTSKDDNTYGEIISNSTADPYYAGSPALWSYYSASSNIVQNALVRWANAGIEFDGNAGIFYEVASSVFQNCSHGVNFDVPNDALVLSGDTCCNVGTPVYVIEGSIYGRGSMTLDCGVISVAMVNDPNQDLSGPDTNKNSESECTFILANNSSTIVAAFDNTHLDEPNYGGLVDVPISRTSSHLDPHGGRCQRTAG